MPLNKIRKDERRKVKHIFNYSKAETYIYICMFELYIFITAKQKHVYIFIYV